jgi:hypothetical protein
MSKNLFEYFDLGRDRLVEALAAGCCSENWLGSKD